MCKKNFHEEIKLDVFYTFTEVAQILRMSEGGARLRRHKNMPMPKSFKVGKRILTRGSAIIEFIKERES